MSEPTEQEVGEIDMNSCCNIKFGCESGVGYKCPKCGRLFFVAINGTVKPFSVRIREEILNKNGWREQSKSYYARQNQKKEPEPFRRRAGLRRCKGASDE